MQLDFEVGDDIEYKVEAIWDSTIDIKLLETGHLPGLYYLIS